MNEVPLTFGLLVAQIAAVGAVALLLETWVARRSPAAASRLLLFALVATPLLTIAAFCPWPVRWRMEASAPAPADVVSTPAMETNDAAPTNTGFDALALLRRLPRIEAQPDSPRLGQALIAVWSLVAGACALRLIGGLWSVNRLRRRSRLVHDESANALLAELSREMGLRGVIELREADAPGLPATAGWFRPMILLPPGWRAWSAAERRAALAHELAHVRAGDYVIGVIAKLATLPHGYHPLPRFLVARLRLRQELAADALGAAHAGGRRAYVRALARLALREPAGAGVPASLLVSAHGGALFRRIQMLRNTEEARPLSRAVRGLTLAVLIGSTLLAASLRGPAIEPRATPAATPAANEPFDLSYLSADAKTTHAIVCFRPAQLIAQPGMDAYAKLMHAELAAELKKVGRQLPEGLTVADIDQVVADVQLQVHLSGKKGERSIMAGASHLMVRMTKDVDWLPLLTALIGDVEIKTQDGHTIYVVKWAVLGPHAVPLYAIDRRTVVVIRQDKGKFVIPTKGANTFADRIGPNWKQVARSTCAVALDNGDGYWTNDLGPEVKDVTGMAEMLKASRSFCLGVGMNDGIDVRAFITAKDETTAKACAAAIAVLSKFVASSSDVEPGKGENPAGAKLLAEMLASGKVECVGAEVRASGHSSVKLVDLASGIPDAKAEAKEKK